MNYHDNADAKVLVFTELFNRQFVNSLTRALPELIMLKFRIYLI